MTCPKCGGKCKRRRAQDYYCPRHGDMPKPDPSEPIPFMGPYPNVVLSRPAKAQKAAI